MAFEQKDFTGALFRNEKKEGPNHSDFNGSIKIAGQEYWLNGWKKKKNGKPWLSLSAKPKQASQGGVPGGTPGFEF